MRIVECGMKDRKEREQLRNADCGMKDGRSKIPVKSTGRDYDRTKKHRPPGKGTTNRDE